MGIREASEAITEIMRRQSLDSSARLPADPAAAALPLRMVYVDEESGALVIGLAEEAKSAREAHERVVRSLAGDADVTIKYVGIVRDACPGKKQDCRPIRGGVRMNGDATLNLVVKQRVDGVEVVQTITSSHAVGNGTGQKVGQSASTATYGQVIKNPPLAGRASDAALTNMSNRRIEGSPYSIWRGPDMADFIVNDFAISANTPVNLVVYMQGAMAEEVARGKILQTGVTITDAHGTLTNQVCADYLAAGGDSGAPVFYLTDVDGYVVYVGIHAGRVIEDGDVMPFYSPWEGVRGDLELDLIR